MSMPDLDPRHDAPGAGVTESILYLEGVSVSFDGFKAMVKACRIRMNGPVLEYKSIYGDRITLDTSFEKTPTINGKPVDYAPEKVFESPFLNADWNSGIVTISKGNRKKVLNFESENSAQRN